MKLQRFFVEEKLSLGKEITIKDVDFVHQVLKVFRKRTGDQIVLLDNSGFEFLSTITVLGKKELTVLIEEESEVENKPKIEVTLFASLIKKDKFEWVLEKCTELGVSHFVPVISERSEKKDLNIDRAQKILKEASEQSERGVMPTICEPLSLSEALYGVDFTVLVFHLLGEKFDAEKTTDVSRIGILVGPEGGWGEKDLEIFKKNNIQLVTLGSQVLRAETASIAAASKILL
ncbi:MAG: RsmE family RNA methyltransferase [bacterium]